MKRLKYRYVPKGEPVRKALDQSKNLTYILCGKVVCTLPIRDECRHEGASRLSKDI